MGDLQRPSHRKTPPLPLHTPTLRRPRDHKRTAGQPETPAWMDAFRIRRQYCQKTVCRCAYPLHACRAFHNTGLLFGKELHRVLVQVRPEAKNHEPYTVTSYLIVMLSLQHIRAHILHKKGFYCDYYHYSLNLARLQTGRLGPLL